MLRSDTHVERSSRNRRRRRRHHGDPLDPPAEVTEEVLIKADAEARRFAREWDRLTKETNTEAEGDALRCIFDHAGSLIEFLAAAPVQSATTAALSLRHILGGLGEQGLGDGLNDGNDADEFHRTGLARIPGVARSANGSR